MDLPSCSQSGSKRKDLRLSCDFPHPNSSFSIAIALARGSECERFCCFHLELASPKAPPSTGALIMDSTTQQTVLFLAGQIPSLGFTWQLLLGTPVSEQSHKVQKDTENRRLTPSLSNLLVERVHRWS